MIGIFDIIIGALCSVICYIAASIICDTYIIEENLVWMIAGMVSITLANISYYIHKYSQLKVT